MKDFKEFQTEYMAFLARIRPILLKFLPNDEIGWQKEAMELEPMYFEAEDFRSLGASHYYKAKHFKMEFLAKEEGRPASALSELAKAACFLELWYMENSEGVCAAIKDRKIKIAQLQKLSAP